MPATCGYSNKMGFRRLSAFVLGVFMAAALITTLYYVNEVREARLRTSELVLTTLVKHGAPSDAVVLSSKQRSTLLAIEDPTFMRHRGVDFETPGAGTTTITQGLVKLLYFPKGFRPGIAKIRQTLIARYALDPLVSKEDQLQVFVKICYLGHTNGQAIHGFEKAALAYFGKELASLSDNEFLSLVAMLIAPNKLEPGSRAHSNRMRRISDYLAGEYQPVGLLDFKYNNVTRGTPAEELLVAFLRILTGSIDIDK